MTQIVNNIISHFKEIKILSWNIASIKIRLSDVHHYINCNDIDVICLQECKLPHGKDPPKLSNYIAYNLQSKHSLILYVNNKLPHELIEEHRLNGPQYHGVKILLGRNTFNIINNYIPANQFSAEYLPSCIDYEPTVLVGDFNARHVRLGNSSYSNTNGTCL